MSLNPKRVIIIGGGTAGLSAAYTLKKRGISTILFEANDRVGGRLGGDRVEGFRIDEGADFFCSSFDETFRLCQELGLPLIKSRMNLGWYLNGEWVRATPFGSLDTFFSNLKPLRVLGFFSPPAALASLKLLWHNRQEAHCLNFSSTSCITEIDSDESFVQYLDRVGVPHSLRKTFRGFLEMTMGDVDDASAAYMRTYLADILFKSNQLYVPEKGVGELSHSLAKECGDAIRPSTPVKNVAIQNGAVTGVALGRRHRRGRRGHLRRPCSKSSGNHPNAPAIRTRHAGRSQIFLRLPGCYGIRPAAPSTRLGPVRCILKTKPLSSWIDRSIFPHAHLRARAPSIFW